MHLIDLTVPLTDRTPVFPGDPATVIKPGGKLAEDGYSDHYVSMVTHAGTHIDAPSHMLAEGKNLDQFSVQQFVGRGIYIKVEAKKFDLATLQAAGIREGDIVLFHTGLGELYQQPAYFTDYPDIPLEVAEYLVAHRVRMVGFDMCSPDHSPYTMHKILLGGGVLIIENVTNLAQLAGKDFTVYALPIKLQLDGAPARVLAQLDESVDI
jgi:kynurenine formamidase